MSWMKRLVIASVFALPAVAATLSGALATETTATKKPTKEQLSAYETKCSNEADAKGLFSNKGKREERKTFRTACIKKLVAE